jgi:hypothetical protein
MGSNLRGSKGFRALVDVRHFMFWEPDGLLYSSRKVCEWPRVVNDSSVSMTLKAAYLLMKHTHP